jgi:hypothetical protein
MNGATGCSLSVDGFQQKTAAAIHEWRMRLGRLNTRRAVLWGGGSKSVAFLHAIGIPELIECVVDINPFKQNKFIPPFGHRVISPDDLVKHPPDFVIVMNPIYRDEVRQALSSRGLTVEPLTVSDAIQ